MVSKRRLNIKAKLVDRRLNILRVPRKFLQRVDFALKMGGSQGAANPNCYTVGAASPATFCPSRMAQDQITNLVSVLKPHARNCAGAATTGAGAVMLLRPDTKSRHCCEKTTGESGQQWATTKRAVGGNADMTLIIAKSGDEETRR